MTPKEVEFENRIKDAKVSVVTVEHVFISYINTEEGRDKNDCYERIIDNSGKSFYVNTNNRNSVIYEFNPFWYKLESLYTRLNKSQSIQTDSNALKQRIDREVKRAVEFCQHKAKEGYTFVYFETDRDINFEVRNILDKEYKLFVPTIFNRTGPSKLDIEHNGTKTEFKLQWYNK